MLLPYALGWPAIRLPLWRLKPVSVVVPVYVLPVPFMNSVRTPVFVRPPSPLMLPFTVVAPGDVEDELGAAAGPRG